jgi:glycosyltransferase involved in cell wall biosynthesis
MGEARRRPVAILICFSCAPGEGSERGVGWAWAKAASDVADVILITASSIHRPQIEAAIAELELPITVRWVDLPSWLSRLIPAKVGFGPYYCGWQAKAGFLIRRIERRQAVDVVHHVTWASDSLPSALLASRAPVRVWGPVGGTTRTAWGLYRYLTLWGKSREIVRDITNGTLRATTGTWLARHATLVVAMNKDVEAKWRSGTTPVIMESNMAMNNSELAVAAALESLPEGQQLRTALFVGRLIHWKGLLLAVQSLRYAPGWRLVVLGEGPDRKHATALAKRIGVEDRLEFRGNVPRADVLGAFRSASALLFPSFHDSAPWAVGEATSMGCPVISLDAGGPARQAGRNAHVVPIAPARTLPQRIGMCLEGLSGRGEPDDIWREDRVPGLLRDWYLGSGFESSRPGDHGCLPGDARTSSART